MEIQYSICLGFVECGVECPKIFNLSRRVCRVWSRVSQNASKILINDFFSHIKGREKITSLILSKGVPNKAQNNSTQYIPPGDFFMVFQKLF